MSEKKTETDKKESEAAAEMTPTESLAPSEGEETISPVVNPETAGESEALTSQQIIAKLNAEDYKGSELMDVLAEIETLIAQARSLPMSSSVLVNKAQALSLLDSARKAMPADIRIANQIVAGANAVIERSQEEANDILAKAQDTSEQIQADARTRADELVSQERVVVMAEERAKQIVEKASNQAKKLAAGADKYCEDKLAKLEDILQKLQEQSAAGRKVLTERSKFDSEKFLETDDKNDQKEH